MATITTTQLHKEVKTLREKLDLFRSFLIGILGRDEEGEYKQEFVKEVLQATQEKPIGVFKDKESFLKAIS